MAIASRGHQALSSKGIGSAIKLGATVILMALLPASAYPQGQRGPPTVRSDAEKKEDAAIDKAYQQAIKGGGDKKPVAKKDPWDTVRPAANDTMKR